jgi:hypothetical protein
VNTAGMRTDHVSRNAPRRFQPNKFRKGLQRNTSDYDNKVGGAGTLGRIYDRPVLVLHSCRSQVFRLMRQTLGEPETQAPARQVSPRVQGLPSLQAVPSVTFLRTHTPATRGAEHQPTR